MPRLSIDQRRAQYQEVLTHALASSSFSRRDIQLACQLSTTRFVGNALVRLVTAGWLTSTGNEGRQVTYSWTRIPNAEAQQIWIEHQLSGTQIADAPPEERPRERLLERGPQQLKTSELLAILIRSGRPGESAVQAGQKLVNRLDGHLDRLPTLSPHELKAISRAVSEVAYCQIMAGVELGRRVAQALGNQVAERKLNSTRAAVEYCQLRFARLADEGRQEEFHIVTLDTKLKPIQSHRITVGTLDASLVHPREVFRAAIRDAASAILLVHNHPSGDPTPSQQDREVTERLKRAGELLGIQVIDHVIVAREECVSLAEFG